MIPVPSSNKHGELVAFANELVQQCRVSAHMRAAYYRMMNAICETGRYDGSKSLINLLYAHIARTAAHLFSPIELKFSIDFENPQPQLILDRGNAVGKQLTRTWERNRTRMTFARGVFESLKYGAAIHKQWVQEEDELPVYYDKIVMPWAFGVFREDENRIDRQEALCETTMLTGPEVWSRIYHLPNARKLYDDIMVHAKAGEATAEPNSFFHQILSTSQINTGVTSASRPMPGGILQMSADPNYAIMGPVVAPAVVQMHELWVKDDTGDYTTIQLVEPGVLIAPLFKKSNLLGVKRQHPYRLIQPNEVTNWFWGRSELVDLIEPQALLSVWADDVKRLFGLQVDKILGFVGETGMNDELYAQFRGAGWTNLPQGSDIKDITPKMPPEAIPMLKFVIEIINMIGSFPEIMQGKGEAGVRAGVHADTLLKTGSPTLRERSLIVEEQCADAADLTLQLMEAKDPQRYWLQADKPLEDVEKTSFLLADIPDDRRVTVDSHSTSPIFSDDTKQLIYQAAKLGYVTGEYVIDNLPFPDKERAKAQLRKREMEQAEFLQKALKEHPEIADKILGKQLGKK